MEKSKATAGFHEAIEKYLNARAESDEQFAKRYPDPRRPVSMCCDYIVERVREIGRIGFSDDEIFGMAVHFYDEDITDVKKGATAGVHIVHNKAVEITDEDRAEAKRKALEQLEFEERERLLAEKKKQQERKERERLKREAARRADNNMTSF